VLGGLLVETLTGEVSGSGALLVTVSSVSTGKPSRAQYSKPPIISCTW
jgi:hypothetical protein